MSKNLVNCISSSTINTSMFLLIYIAQRKKNKTTITSNKNSCHIRILLINFLFHRIMKYCSCLHNSLTVLSWPSLIYKDLLILILGHVSKFLFFSVILFSLRDEFFKFLKYSKKKRKNGII